MRNPIPMILAAGAVIACLAGAAQAKSDQGFLDSAIQGNLAEIAAGKLAEQKSNNSDVKTFGQTLIKDHGKANKQAEALAKSKGITPPTSPTAEAQGEYKKLAALSGTAFDQAFAKAMIKDHKMAIKLFQSEAKVTGEVGLFAKDTVPVLQTHLKMAQAIANNKTAKK